MKKYDFYLAHPLLLRKIIRPIELAIEKEYDVDIFNPFYDVFRQEIEDIDNGKSSEYNAKFDHIEIVETDLFHLRNAKNLLCIVEEKQSIGTHCEMWDSVRDKRPIYIIATAHFNHPWLIYAHKVTGGSLSTCWNDFIEQVIKKQYKKR
jgi:hypothetical protein